MNFEQDNTISKLKLLFVLDKMEIPLTENNIIDICTSSNNWFSYLDVKEAMYPGKADSGWSKAGG